jgi:adenylylsulfate kinase-like enzyme
LCGPARTGKQELAKRLEERLFDRGRFVYYLGLSNTLLGSEAGVDPSDERDETLHRLGEISHLFTDAGLILITTVSSLDDEELDTIRTLNQPNDCLVVHVGQDALGPDKADLQLDDVTDPGAAVLKIEHLLAHRKYLPEYYL